MADIKFACPHCSQHITCDELWGGHQLDCPNCKNPLSVPAKAAPAAAGPAALVPKVPTVAEPKLSVTGGTAQQPATTGQKAIPIRNLAPQKAKKKSPLVTYGVGALVVVIL